ncbi:MAG: DUF2800 domain-containing protein [Chromatiales bacterium]|nr:DUF2800 domain-containing protein [Chromatiales bacterium]
MTAVAGLRASAAPRWVPCPGSAHIAALFPDKETSEAAEGTAAHEMLEACVKGEVSDPTELIGRHASNGVEYTNDMATGAALAIEWVTENMHPGFMSETEVRIDDLNVIGHVDIAGPDKKDRRTLRVVDYKFGRRFVPASDNWQLLVYAQAIVTMFEGEFDFITLTVIQPRWYGLGGKIRHAVISVDDLPLKKQAIAEAAASARSTTPRYAVGEHCRDCTGAHYCQLIRDTVLNAQGLIEHGQYAEGSARETADEITVLRRLKTLLETRLDAVEQYGLTLPALPGFRHEPSFSNRAWRKDVDLTTYETLFGVQLHDKKPKTPAASERAGLPKDVVDKLATRYQTGVKLVEYDAVADAEEKF